MGKIEREKSWGERLLLACTFEASNEEEENQHYRKIAIEAPLEELELFLSKPAGRFDTNARAVMGQVLRKRTGEIETKNKEQQKRREWWQALLQQISGQVIASLITGLIIGFITGQLFGC